jgi:hypothetical protein
VSLLARLLLLTAALAGLPGAGVASAAASGGRWRPPLPHATVARAFTFDRAAPYARGMRRGVDLRGEPGARVVAACAGTVAYAGRVPGWGRGVTLRCGGGLVATELGLASATATRGSRLWPGAVVGRLGARGVLRLGARRAGARHGYIDPLGLLGRAGPPAPTVAPRGGPAPLRRRRATPPRPRPAPVATPAAAPRAIALPWLVAAGVGLLAAGAGGGSTLARRRRRRTRGGIALAQR